MTPQVLQPEAHLPAAAAAAAAAVKVGKSI
jgi:hypothetical protein